MSSALEEGGSRHLVYCPDRAVRDDHRLRTLALVEIVHDLFGGRSGRHDSAEPKIKILDMACGRGELAVELQAIGYDVTAVDADRTCLDICAAKGVRTRESDYLGLPALFPSDQFDLVITSHSLEHLQNPRDELRNLVNVAKRYVLIAVPNPLSLPNIFYAVFRRVAAVQPGHLYVWDHRHLKNFVENHVGLRIIAWYGDFVRVLPRRAGVRDRLQRVGVVRPIEMGLAKILPSFAVSVIVLCEKPER